MRSSQALSAYRFGPREYDLAARTYVMGILNVTPDSFSDGGLYADAGRAVAHGLQMAEDGADFIDVGGESTRPGSEPVPEEEELRRVVPVIERLVRESDVPVSIDTWKSRIAERALGAGAVLVNDISGLHFDPALADVARRYRASVILMHIRGTPKTMQTDTPRYGNVIEEICSYLEEGLERAHASGLEQLIVDPGIGFGKGLHHNLEILGSLNEFHRFGYPVLVGPSRKSFIGTLLDLPPSDRVEGTAAAVAIAIANGANIVRVHDVKAMKRVATVVDAIIHR